MKIFSNNLYNAPIKTQGYKTNSAASFKGTESVSCDCFVKTGEGYKAALDKLQKITKEEYLSLTQNDKELLRKKVEKTSFLENIKTVNSDETVALHEFCANSIKKVLDKKYGEGNYVAVPIGRSLSSIGKALSLKIGEENVKNIPMSILENFYFPNDESGKKAIDEFSKTKGFEDFKKLLDSMGLSRDAVLNSDKQYVLLDYTSSGISLEAAFRILNSKEFFGNKKCNLCATSLNKILNIVEMPKDKDLHAIKDKVSKVYPNVKNDGQILPKLISDSRFKPLSLIGKTKYDFSNIPAAADYRKIYETRPESIEKRKLFGFALLDSFHTRTKPSFADMIELSPRDNRYFTEGIMDH